MKTTYNKALIASVSTSALALIVLTKLAASFVPTIVVVGSYIVVGALFGFAAMDYRLGSKKYSTR